MQFFAICKLKLENLSDISLSLTIQREQKYIVLILKKKINLFSLLEQRISNLQNATFKIDDKSKILTHI